jgi:hypothetical protein
MSAPRPTLASHESRLDNHQRRLDDHEARLDSYDKILVKLDTLIDVLTRHTESLDARVNAALDGQATLKERNEGTHRWSTAAWSVATGVIVGVIMFVVGHGGIH